jgi:hypothetical protein
MQHLNWQTFVSFEVERILFVRDDFQQTDNVRMVKLAEDLDLSNSSDWKPIKLVFEANLLQGNEFA